MPARSPVLDGLRQCIRSRRDPDWLHKSWVNNAGLGSTVEIGSVLNGTGGTVQVTFVTFLENGTFSTIGFCADQASLFPMDQTVFVNFNPGQTCATVITIVIVG